MRLETAFLWSRHAFCYAISGMDIPPIRRVNPTNQPPDEVPRVYSAPRRFGIGTLLVVATACGVLIWLLQLLGTPPSAIISIGVFLAVVAAMQVGFGPDPRLASQCAGVVCTVGWFFYYVISRQLFDCAIMCSLPVIIGLGVAAGYCGGALVAGLFMTMEHAGKYFWRNTTSSEEPDSVWDRED